jgi:transcription elongation factor GreA
MTEKIVYLTAEGLEKLKSELTYLKLTRRRELADRIEAAKSLGDLSENAEYHEAKDALAFLEGRVREIEEILKNYSIIPAEQMGDTIHIGSNVEVEVRGVKKNYKIVGANEANPVEGLISNESPLGSAFIGRRVGEEFVIETPGGAMTYRILSIS